MLATFNCDHHYPRNQQESNHQFHIRHFVKEKKRQRFYFIRRDISNKLCCLFLFPVCNNSNLNNQNLTKQIYLSSKARAKESTYIQTAASYVFILFGLLQICLYNIIMTMITMMMTLMDQELSKLNRGKYFFNYYLHSSP
jgi:hypothetical protein